VPSNAESATDHGPWLYRCAFLMETLDVTGGNGALFISIPEKRFGTRAFYSQSTFNLLREESEGLSKLVSLIGDTTRLR
jgi:THO complex subunit 2 N-terminus